MWIPVRPVSGTGWVVTMVMVRPYLPLDTLHLVALRVDLVPHVDDHALQVPHDAPHVGQVLLHLVLSPVMGNPVTQRDLADDGMHW